MQTDPCVSAIASVDAVINNSFTNDQSASVCNGDSLLIGGNYYAVTGNYTDSLTTSYGCDSIITTYLSSSNVVAQIYSQNNILYSNITSGMVPYSYLWSTGEITSSIIPVNPGVLWFLVTDAYNCTSDTAYFVIEDVNAIDENDIIYGLNIFPNPTDGLVIISFESIENSDYTISILNVLGEVIFEDKLMQFLGSYQKKINLDNLAKSVYLIRIETSELTINKKLILR